MPEYFQPLYQRIFLWVVRMFKEHPIRTALQIACFMSGITTFFLFQTYRHEKNDAIEKAKNQARNETKRAATEVNEFLTTLRSITTSIANELSSGALQKENDILRRVKEKSLQISGLGIAFTPYGLRRNKQLFAPYFVEKEGKHSLVYLEDFLDYTLPENKRYNEPLKKGAMFLEPLFDKASDTIVAEFTTPFFYPDLRPRGIVFANQSFEHMQHILRGLKLGSSGYGFLITGKGHYVAHPDESLVKSEKTIFEVAEDMKNPELATVAKRATEGESGFIDHENVATGQKSWMFFEPIPAAEGWSLFGVYVKGEIRFDYEALNRRLIQIVLNLLIFLLLLALLLIKVYKGGSRRLWFSSIAWIITLVIAIIFVWSLAKKKSLQRTEVKDEVIIYDRNTLTQFLETIKEKRKKLLGIEQIQELTGQQGKKTTPPETKTKMDVEGTEIIPIQQNDPKGAIPDSSNQQGVPIVKDALEETEETLEQTAKDLQETRKELLEAIRQEEAGEGPLIKDPQQVQAEMEASGIKTLYEGMFIPTGLYVNHLEFVGATDVEIMGQVWQRYHKNQHKDIPRELVFPQSKRPDSGKLTEAYRYIAGDWETIGWSFKVLLSQDFNYLDYPFDSKNIQIQLWPKDFDKGVVLIPDLEAYPVVNPTSLPGINPQLSPTSWKLEKSYFSYQTQKYKTNFGFYATGPFGIIERSTKSQFPDLFFNITANRELLNVLIIDLFPLLIVMIILFVALFMAATGLLSFYNILGTGTSLFFTIIIAHLRFKSIIPIQQVVFFEYLFFVSHFIILITMLLNIIYFLKLNIRVIQYENMLIPRLLYWPFIGNLILILSLIFFY